LDDESVMSDPKQKVPPLPEYPTKTLENMWHALHDFTIERTQSAVIMNRICELLTQSIGGSGMAGGVYTGPQGGDRPGFDRVAEALAEIKLTVQRLAAYQRFCKRPNELPNTGDVCVICQSQRRQIVFKPCGHRACCAACSDTLLELYRVPKCPICRFEICEDDVIFVYDC